MNIRGTIRTLVLATAALSAGTVATVALPSAAHANEYRTVMRRERVETYRYSRGGGPIVERVYVRPICPHRLFLRHSRAWCVRHGYRL